MIRSVFNAYVILIKCLLVRARGLLENASKVLALQSGSKRITSHKINVFSNTHKISIIIVTFVSVVISNVTILNILEPSNGITEYPRSR